MSFAQLPYPKPSGNDKEDIRNILAYLQSLAVSPPQNIQTGMILLWCTGNTPPGFLPCVGQTLLRAKYPQLWGLPLNGFGPGNGTTTFTLQNPTTPTGMIYIIKT